LYFRKQLKKSTKQNRVLESTTGSNLEELSEAESQHSIYEEEEPRKSFRVRRPTININSNDFRVYIPELEANSIPSNFLSG